MLIILTGLTVLIIIILLIVITLSKMHEELHLCRQQTKIAVAQVYTLLSFIISEHVTDSVDPISKKEKLALVIEKITSLTFGDNVAMNHNTITVDWSDLLRDDTIDSEDSFCHLVRENRKT